MKKKYALYILILITLVGLFGSAERAQAQTKMVCVDGTLGVVNGLPEADCKSPDHWVKDNAPGMTPGPATAAPPAPQSDFEKAMASRSCVSWSGADIPWCFVVISNLIFHTVPAFYLRATAYFFNVLISVTLSGDVFKQAFVPQAWAIVRDLSNIFFILILLYIAIKIILGLGGSNVKKMITTVIITALLINFSMFFTQVIIDTSNIVALIFYNKISVSTKDASGNLIPRPYDSVGGEKDVAGGMVSAFDPTTPLKKAFFDEASKIYYTDPVTKQTTAIPGTEEVPAGTMIALILISGLIMSFAIYALFISGLSFLGRLMELWILIIFSPFALMSSTVPKLAGIEYLGWDAWFKRLLKVSFMAPIFMFFLYFIFMLISSNVFEKIVKPTTGANDAAGAIKMLLGVVMPAILICILLLKATEFAKKGSGKFGEVMMSGAKMVGGLALGAATGGAAIAGRAVIGRAGTAVASSKWAQKWEARGWGGEYARRAATAVGTGSFDIRGVKIRGKTLAGATGMNLGEAQKGGFMERRKADVERRQKRAQSLEVGEDETLKQHLNTMEDDMQEVLNQHVKEIEDFDRDIKDAKEINDPVAIRAAINAKKNAVNAWVVKTIDSTGKEITTTVGGPGGLKGIINDKKSEIIEENRKRKGRYAQTTEGGLGRVKDFIFSGGQNSYKGSREAAHKIRMEQKIETGEKH